MSPPVLSVTQLNTLIKEVLAETFPLVWVSAELSDVAKPRSGHIYLTLKDESSQIKGVIWRNTAARLPFQLEDGQHVICAGSLDVYPPRGTYQLVIREIEPQGVGALQLAFRQLHAKLAAEGLFDAERKRSLPRIPRRVTVVTSPTGAAVRDFLEVLRRRWQGIEVLIVPTRVQGAGAAAEIARAIRVAHRMEPRPDAIVITRGGGSLEDLWCFNEEEVVRAVSTSPIPTISAVGHEIDVTLCDLAADVRALTPSEAAERLVPSREEVLAMLDSLGKRMVVSLRGRAVTARQRLDALARRRPFVRPFDLIHDRARRLDELEQRTERAFGRRLERLDDRLVALAARLDGLSPLRVLRRGYSVTQRAADGQVVRDASDVGVGDEILTRLAAGSVRSRVESAELGGAAVASPGEVQ
ncbi:MAG: exodeoxyribonuclease VII large subunit [Planctomycetales bacterium]|nr:exodeoxyribonuclease VII large subunit [Planctomycetales bacterium]